MSKFVVSARKYRPNRFQDVVGQEHVSNTLKNALQNEKLAHAFLFCGPRGVGKTTCARILAKVLNCQDITKDFEACNKCSSCSAFNENASFNITELDAASNNSVEHIRALIEQVRFQPQQGKYKVFIIDEVHMLSQQAFNAFLKTLEEPPPYAIFILATTEKHKIIPTILSRCQIFDFRRIQVNAIVEQLEHICKEEKIKADKDALHIIAQKADGALRDALSIFDRIVSFSVNEIKYDDVIENLNVLDYDYFFKIVDAIISEDLANVLLVFNDILKKGFDPDIFINGLAEHIRNILVCQDEQTIQLLEVSDSLKQKYQDQAKIASPSLLLTALNIANDCDVNFKMARNKRLHVEMAIIKMTYINRAVKLAGEKKTAEQGKTVVTQKINSSSSNPVIEKTIEASTPVKAITDKVEADIVPVSKPIPPTTKKTITTLSDSLTMESNYDTLSLPSLEELKDDIQKEEHNKQDKKSLLSFDNLTLAWKKFVDQLDSPSVKNTFANAELQLEGTTVKVLVGTKMAKGQVQGENEVMPFLRKELSEKDLSMVIEIDPSKIKQDLLPKPPKPLTDKEKYEKMMLDNPVIDDIRKRFNLKLDHTS